MLKAIILAFALLITTIINGITGMLGQPSLLQAKPNTISQDQAAPQTSKHSQKGIKTNLKALPKNQIGVSKQDNKITIAAGDKGVTLKTIQSALSIINTLSLPILQDNINLTPSKDVDIVLFSSKTSYANSLQKAGVDTKLIPALVANSGGVTVGADIWIPLYALQDKAELANVLTHELTHVVFNQIGIGENLPTWINEGTAWYDGLAAQAKVNSSETKLDMASLQNEVLAAGKSGKLYPLSANEPDIINAPYNVEYEDYLAVNYLIKNYGKATFQQFLQECENQSVNSAFQGNFGMGMKSFENSVYQSL
ncbi:MAG TPA: hypothetical protein VFF14_03375 [Candidatus Deferrimicrobium sp.]|nr:hypothetical protein [Candidatus Deferrimicrobium sp.]